MSTLRDVEVIEETALALAQASVSGAMRDASLSKAALARRMGCPPSFITRMLRGDHNLTIKTYARALAACGFEPEFKRVAR